MAAAPPYDTQPDEALMANVAAGEQDAFVVLVRRHQNGLVNFFRKMGDYTDAEDLAQEAFLRVFRYREKYRPTAKFTTFLYLIARRTRIDRLRKQDRQRKAYETLAEDVRIGESVTGSGKDAGQRAFAALSLLSEEMRTVVVMSIYQGFKYREIADALEIPLGTVKTRMFNALKKLRQVMEAGDDE